MAGGIHLELDGNEGAPGLIGGLARHSWLRVEADGDRLRLLPVRGHPRPERMLAEVTAHFPHAVTLAGADARPARDHAAARAWLRARSSAGFAVFSYDSRGEERRHVFCFRRPEDACRFGRRFL